MQDNAPMICSAYYSKLALLAAMAFLAAFVAVLAWLLPHVPHHEAGPAAMRLIAASLLSFLIVNLLHSFFTTRAIVRVDETGIYDSRGWYPLLEWPDVLTADAVGRGNEETSGCLRLTMRYPNKYHLVAKFVRLTPVEGPGCAVIFLNFSCLTPRADVVAECIHRHLARRGVTMPAASPETASRV